MDRKTSAKAPWYDLNASRPAPRIVEVDPGVLPEPWRGLCARNRIRLFAVIGYENEARNIKIWPASNIIARGIERGNHLEANGAMVESSSGNFVFAEAAVLEQVLQRWSDFPVRKVIAVVNKSLQPRKLELLRANKFMEVDVVEADSAATAMLRAEELARTRGYWYTRQYWNADNSDSYEPFAAGIVHQLPELGIWAAGVGSGGTFAGTVPVMREAFRARANPQRLHCVAVAVEPGGSVGGVRTEIGLMLDGTPGLPWRKFNDDTSYVGLPMSLKMSAALWQQSPDDPEKRVIGGESTGFALAGGLLSVLDLEAKEQLGALRGENGDIQMAFVAPDTREPYREDYAAIGITFPE